MFFLRIHFIAKKSKNKQKNVLMKCEMFSSSLYTDEYYTHEYIKEMTRFRAEEKLVIYDKRRIRKSRPNKRIYQR